MNRTVACDVEVAEASVSAEAHLWRAVVAQAIEDATKLGRKPSTDPRKAAAELRDRDQARHWLLTNSRDFQQICAWAGLDSDDVLLRARRIAANGWTPP